MDLTREQRIQRHKEWLKSNWKLLAAFSWERHLVKGRGAVVVPEEDFVNADVPRLARLRLNYLPLSDRDAEAGRAVLSEKELAWLESYDPAEMVVLCVLREGGGVSSYLFAGNTKPSDAYAMKKAEGN